MKKQVSPALVWSILGLVVVAILVIGLRVFNVSYKPDKSGSETTMQQYQKTGSFYTPPIPGGAPATNGAPPSAPGTTGYNLTPPSH